MPGGAGRSRGKRRGGRAGREDSFGYGRKEGSRHHPRMAVSRGWLANTGARAGRRLLVKIIFALDMKGYGQAADAEKPKLHCRAELQKNPRPFGK